MSNKRADLGFSDELDSFDPQDWQPKRKTVHKDAPKAAKQAAEASGFKSREPEPPTATAVPRRGRRTGRNAQFNIKAKPETIEAFCEIADQQGWGLGETLEFAVELLGKSYSAKK